VRSGDVLRLPRRPLSADETADLKRSLTAAPLTRRDLLHGPVEAIDGFGPWVAAPGTPVAADLERVAAIVRALNGPGRVPLVVGAQAAIDLLQRVVDGANR
jgi:hypothetical protein